MFTWLWISLLTTTFALSQLLTGFGIACYWRSKNWRRSLETVWYCVRHLRCDPTEIQLLLGLTYHEELEPEHPVEEVSAASEEVAQLSPST